MIEKRQRFEQIVRPVPLLHPASAKIEVVNHDPHACDAARLLHSVGSRHS